MIGHSLITNSYSVFVKEIRVLTRSPLLYVLGAVFLGLTGYFFYTDVLYFDLLNQDKVGLTQGLWQRFFEDLRLCLLVVTPVLAARVFAEERRLGTMELLLTYPLTEVELVSGKFLSLLLLFIPLLAVTVIYPLALTSAWSVDPWPLIATYLGAMLLSITCLSCGMFCSVLATQQSSAALVAFGVLFFFWFLAWNEAAAGPMLLAALRRLSLFDRFHDFSRGTVHSRDVVYFLVVTSLFVLFSLEALRWHWQRWRSSALRIILLVGIGVGIEDCAVRHNRTWDLVQEKESVLGPETVQILGSLQAPVRLTLFYEPGRYRETAYLAEKFSRSSPLVTVRLVDLDREPALARTYGVRAYGTVVVEATSRQKVVYPAEEGQLVRAMTSVTDPRPRLVCVSTGHGEREVTTERRKEDDEPASLGELFERLGYGWQEVVLAQERAVLQDCRLLFVHGPTRDFSENEIDTIERFLAGGGSILVLLDLAPLPRFERFLRGHQIIPGGEIVPNDVGRLYLRDRSTLPVVDVALSTRMPERFTAVFYGARQIDFTAAESGTTGGIFLGYRAPSLGLIPVGVAAETTGEENGHGRLMVVGDADFLEGALFQRAGNRVLFSTMLAWLSDHRERQPATSERYAYAPLTRGQVQLLFWVTMTPPLSFLVGGGFAWWRRKKG
jgi:ABC-2 type transport system permease protein